MSLEFECVRAVAGVLAMVAAGETSGHVDIRVPCIRVMWWPLESLLGIHIPDRLLICLTAVWALDSMWWEDEFCQLPVLASK